MTPHVRCTAVGAVLERLLRLLALVAIAVPFALGPAKLAHAAAFTVNSTADATDANAFDGVCRTAANTCTLRAAIQQANFNAAFGDSSTITLPAGEFRLAIAGRNEDGAATGDLDISGILTITGAGASATEINGRELDRVFDIRPGATVSITGLTIFDGDPGPLGTGCLPGVPCDATFGGGIRNKGRLTLDRVDFVDNTSSFEGGGLANLDGQTVLIANGTFRGNLAAAFGGAIHNTGHLELTGVTLSGNATTDPSGEGGGLSQSPGPFGNASAELTNVTISGNTAGSRGEGGGILSDVVVGNSSKMTLTNVTVANNTAPTAGGISAPRGELTLKNTLVASNSGGNCRFGSLVLVSDSHNLDSAHSCGFRSSNRSLVDTDPLLGPLQNNGGPTFTQALARFGPLANGSPAIDTGTNSGCPATDQRGVHRPIDGNGDNFASCDIGAYEAPVPITLICLVCTGTSELSPHDAQVRVGQHQPLKLTWTVPKHEVWTDLFWIKLRFKDDRGAVFEVRWDQPTNTLSLVDPDTGQPGPAASPGSGQVLKTQQVELYLSETSVVGGGPKAPNVDLNLSLAFLPPTKSQSFSAEVAAANDFGDQQDFAPAGTVTVSR